MKVIDYFDLQDIRARTLQDDEDGALIINVQSPADFARRHIPGSINVPVSGNGLFAAEVEKLAGDRDCPVVVYCKGYECPASSNAANLLDEAGFTNIAVFEGGINEWEDNGASTDSDYDDIDMDVIDNGYAGRGINTPPAH